jgi:hypothetical protein
VVKNSVRIHPLVVKNKETSRLETAVKKCATSRLKSVKDNDKIRLRTAKDNVRIHLMCAVKSATIRQKFAEDNGKNLLKCVKSVMFRPNAV